MSDSKDPLLLLAEDLLFVKQQFYLQTAEVRALRQFVLGHISKLTKTQQDAATAALAKLTMRLYDALILKMGDENPQAAEAVDIRRKLSPEEREQWYFPDEPL